MTFVAELVHEDTETLTSVENQADLSNYLERFNWATDDPVPSHYKFR